MKIRAKLVSLIFAIFALFGSTVLVYFTLLGPVDAMEREKSLFTKLVDAIKDQQIALNRLPFAKVLQASPAFDAASVQVNEAYKGLAGIQVLVGLSPDVRKALEIIGNLKTLNDERLAEFRKSYDGVKKDAEYILYTLMDVSLDQLFTAKTTGARGARVPEAIGHMTSFLSEIVQMQDAFEASRANILEQYVKIDGFISVARSRALFESGLIALVLIVLTILVALRVAGGIGSSVVRIERNVATLKDGDLSHRSKLATRDEIGALALNLNLFQDALASSILKIKEISAANIEAKNRLTDRAVEAASASTEIEANTLSIGKQIGGLDEHIAESAASIDKIATGIAALDEQIEGQAAMVEEATASVTEMLSSLENMSRITERDKEATDELVAESERGRTVFETAFATIAEIPENIGAIQEMATVIQNIASQTNLLAMNAAIEAAHAGDAGRGFAVVADEIRKLSEASTESSRDITVSINTIVAKIDEATKANAGTNEAFAAIDSKIREVSASMVELYSGIKEIQVGGSQILEAMVDLQSRSLSVKEGSKAMEEGSASIRAMMGNAGRISSEVASNISEIVLGIADIGTSIRSVSGLAEGVGAGSASLDEEVRRFRTEG